MRCGRASATQSAASASSASSGGRYRRQRARRRRRREDVHVREGHRVPRRAALEPEVERDRERQHEQREQEQQRVPERHCPPAQTARDLDDALAAARARMSTTTCVAGRVAVDDAGSRPAPGPGGAGVPNPRARCQATSRSPARHATTIESSTADALASRRAAWSGGRAGVILRDGGGRPLARRRSRGCSRCAAGRSGARGSFADVGGDEHDRAGRGHARADRAPGRAEEREVDRRVAELRVDAGDDEALRAGELVLHLGAGLRAGGRRPTARRPERTGSGPGTRSSRRRSGRPASAATAAACAPGAGTFTPPSGTRAPTGRRRRAAEARPPPANRSVTSRVCRLVAEPRAEVS